MKKLGISVLAFLALGLIVMPSFAQDGAKPKNEVSKLHHARKTDHAVRQVTPDPKKSPGKHAKNLSKNVNHEENRESKKINKMFQGKEKKS